jgi:hypothetical protein
MADDTSNVSSKAQFENTDIISRFQYVNTGKITIPNSNGDAHLDPSTMSPKAVPYSLKGSGEAVGANSATNLPVDAIGVYAAYPSMSPKYVKHNGGHSLSVNLGGLARIYIPVKKQKSLDNIRNSYRERDIQTRKVADTVFGLSKGGGEKTTSGYLDFILMNVSQSLDEKFQVSEVLEDNYVAFFFGQRAPMWTFSGALMNTYQDDWTMNMWRLYSDMGRGTRLAQRGLMLSIRYDSMIITGGMTRFQWDISSSNEMFTSFSFQFLVQNISPIRGSSAPPTKLPDAYKGFYDTDIDYNELNTYEGVMPVINPSEADPTVNDQTAATSRTTNPDAYVDDLYAKAAARNPDAYVDDLYAKAEANLGFENEKALIDLFGSSTSATNNPPRLPMRNL